MPDAAQVNRSLSTIRTELEFLRDSGVLSPPQFQSITAQLPQNGQQSQYVDPRFIQGQQGGQYGGYQGVPQYLPSMPSQIAQNAQDPNNPAHPQHKDHSSWAKGLASKFGQAAVFGAGATFGGDLVNDAFKHL